MAKTNNTQFYCNSGEYNCKINNTIKWLNNDTWNNGGMCITCDESVCYSNCSYSNRESAVISPKKDHKNFHIFGGSDRDYDA